MANALNRTTLEYRESVNTPDYNPVGWVINPDMTQVAGVPQRYWKLIGDAVSEMTAQEKVVVDAAIATEEADASKAAAKVAIDERTIKAFALIVLDEINILRVKTGLAARTADQLRTAMRNKIDEL